MPGKRRKSKRGGKNKNKDLDPDVIIETQEFDYIEVKRIVQNYVKTPILHLFVGRVPQEHWDRNVNYYYFVRRNNTPIGKRENEGFIMTPAIILIPINGDHHPTK